MGIYNKLTTYLTGLALLVSCSTNDLPDSFLNKLERNAINFRYSSYPYIEDSHYDKGQKIDYHFEKQSETGGKGKHLLIMQKGNSKSAYEIIVDYNENKIVRVKKIKEW